MNSVVFLAAAVTFVMSSPWLDLDQPGAMEALKASNPDHYRRVQGVIFAAFRMNCAVPEFERFLRAQYDAEKPVCGPIVKTSYPPQRIIRFRIGDTEYSKTVQFQVRPADERGRLIPAK